MLIIIQNTILFMSASTFAVVAFMGHEWEKIVFYTFCYAIVAFLFLRLESKTHARFFELEERQKEERIIQEMGIKKYFYVGAVVAFLSPALMNEFFDLELLTVIVLYTGILISYVAMVITMLYRFEEKNIEETKTKIQKQLEEKQEEVITNEVLEQKKREVFEMLDKATEKMSEMNVFGSIEKKMSFTEVYKEGIERKLAILAAMSEEQRSKELHRVEKYMEDVLKEAKKFVG